MPCPSSRPDRSRRPDASGLVSVAVLVLFVLAVSHPAPAQQVIFTGSFEQGDLIEWSAFVSACDGDAQCPQQLRFLWRCTGSCVECVDSTDCLANPTALGTTRNAGHCECTGGSCAANPAGPVCAAGPDACTCSGSGDCTPPATCNATPYLGGAPTCW